MEKKFDITIISAFGRGNWLAAELVEKGMKVCLVEVTSLMGRWVPEDWEGPFGYFHTDKLSASQIERLTEDDYHDSVDEGFVLWLKRGPVDMKGPLSSFWLNQLGIDSQTSRYISSFDSMTLDEKKKAQKSFLEDDYSKTWFVHFTHQIASRITMENSRGCQVGRPLPVFSPLNIRRVSRRGFDKSLDWCAGKGVVVFRDAEILDMMNERNEVQTLEIKSDWSGVIESRKFIWGLSSEETLRLPSKVHQKVFPGGAIKPIWTWIRFRIQLAAISATDSLPTNFVILEDPYLPWSHENVLLVQRTVKEQNFDVWVKIPTIQRFQRAYLEEINKRILSAFSHRIPGSSPLNIDMPQDYLYEDSELGPPRFPVFSAEDIDHLKRFKGSNLFYDGPENWESLDWNGQLNYQSQLKDTLLAAEERAQ